MGAGPRRGPSRLGYPGSPGGRPACVSSVHARSLHSLYIHPSDHYGVLERHSAFPAALSTWLACAVPFFFPAVCVVFLRFFWSYTGRPLLFLFGLFTVTPCCDSVTESAPLARLLPPSRGPVLPPQAAVPRGGGLVSLCGGSRFPLYMYRGCILDVSNRSTPQYMRDTSTIRIPT